MRTTGSSLLRCLVLGTFLLLVPGPLQQAFPASPGCAAGLPGAHRPGMFLVIRGPGPLVAAGEPTRMTQPDSSEDESKADWLRRIKHVERRQTLTAIIVLSIVIIVLAVWWSWGKIIHRKRRL
jgi:hypothetical protein